MDSSRSKDILDYWFPKNGLPDYDKWFMKSDQYDEEIKEKFGKLLKEAEKGKGYGWLVNKDSYIANNTTGTFAYIVQTNMYDRLIKELSKLKKPIDQYYIDLQNTEQFLVVYPNLFYCNLEHSNIGESRNNKVWYKKFKWII